MKSFSPYGMLEAFIIYSRVGSSPLSWAFAVILSPLTKHLTLRLIMFENYRLQQNLFTHRPMVGK
jgi:hypothetical protein